MENIILKYVLRHGELNPFVGLKGNNVDYLELGKISFYNKHI
jgi:hypothetical protein